MPYHFVPGRIYRMPTHFGPSPGPRQGEDGRAFANVDSPKTLRVQLSFLTNREQLSELLPAGFGLYVGEEPIVTVQVSYMKDIEWLAGRGYNKLGISFPVVFRGKRDRASGDFLAVLWENLTEPIITGREELGYSKIYCDLPEPQLNDNKVICTAGWLGFRFMDLGVSDLRQVPTQMFETMSDTKSSEGVLHFKYIPRTGDWGRADAAYVVMTPSGAERSRILESMQGQGGIQFHQATWEDMPTQFHIVNAIRQLEIKAYASAFVVRTVGGNDLRSQRILE